MEVSNFGHLVMSYISQIPHGQVATYKQIAELAGKPQASRGVAWILHSCSTKYKLPWHRVINSGGGISFEMNTPQFRRQLRALRAEDIIVSSAGKVDLNRFQWKKRSRLKKNDAQRPKLFSKP